MKVLKTIEGGTVIEGICLRKKIKINKGGPPVYSVPWSKVSLCTNTGVQKVGDRQKISPDGELACFSSSRLR